MSRAALETRGLFKRFGESVAVDGVDLALPPGRVVGLVGENGAGKSTLLNMLSGIVAPDAGEILLPGRGPRPESYAEAQRLGIARVFQEQSLIGPVPVYENLLIGCERQFARAGQILGRREMAAMAQAMIDEAGAAIDVRRRTDSLSFSERQVVEIVRACLAPGRLFGQSAPIVLLDEPTASLERKDEEVFLGLVERTRAQGSLLFVSHRLGEVLRLSDSIVVLKDGRRVAEVDPAETDERELHRLMVGRERDRDYYHEERQVARPPGRAAFAARGLSRSRSYEDVSLAVAPGEILGIGGLLESGKEALGKGLAGVEPPERGEVSIGGGPWSRPAMGRLIGQGAGYVPAERLREGMIASQPLSWNLALANGDIFSGPAGLWRHRAEVSAAREMIARLGIKATGPRMRCDRMSGGNQQKVVLARWLARRLKTLILDNPTRGVDAGAKEEIYRLIRGLTDEGVAIVLITDELLELIGLSNRIAIMRHGRIVRTLPAPVEAKPTEQELVEVMLSAGSEGRAAA